MRVLVVALLVALAVPPVAAAQEAPPPEVQTTKGVTEPVYENSVTESYTVETDHGTIYGEVIRPLTDDGADVTAPVILTYSPYNILSSPINQTGSIAADATADYFVPRGYARAKFDVVGTRESSGCYDYGGIGERETGAAVVDFLGTQPWSNGKVGMIGGSYDGTTAIATAIEAPEHLTTIIPQVAIDRWYDYAYGGGVRYFLNNEKPSDEGFDTPFAFDFGFGFLPPADVTNPELFADAVGTRINPCERIQHTQRGYEFDPVYDEFWVERDYRRLADKVKASVFVEGGWLDHNVKHWDSTRFFLALPEDHPKKLVMGQWTHTSNKFADAQDVRHAWFDYWLMGLDTGVMDLPQVDTQLNTQAGTSDREQESAWPPPGTAEVALDLVTEAPGQIGELAISAGSPSWTDENGAPVTEEEMFSGPAPGTERFVRLTSEPLSSDVRISGSPLVDLLVSSSAEHTQFTPVLYSEAPDGTIDVITRGFLNVRNRNGLDVSEPAPVDEPYRAPVDMWDTDYLVPEGHRLGLVVASDNADWALDDDDPTGVNTMILADEEPAGSVLRVPVSEGQAALGGGDGILGSGPQRACQKAFIPDPRFSDTAENPHRSNIACIAWYLITVGRTQRQYDPALDVTRGQMASFLARLAVDGGLQLPANPPDAFEDDDTSVHETSINELAELGVIEGTGDRDDDGRDEYRPNARIRRDQMATFIARIHERATSALPADPPDAFEDDDGNLHEASINALAELGVIAGIGDTDDDGRQEYGPRRNVPRGQMATFIANDLGLFVAAGVTPPGGARIYLDRTETSGRLRGYVEANKRLERLTADGCGLDAEVVETTAKDFRIALPDGEGACTLTLTAATAARGIAARQRVPYTFEVTRTG